MIQKPDNSTDNVLHANISQRLKKIIVFCIGLLSGDGKGYGLSRSGYVCIICFEADFANTPYSMSWPQKTRTISRNYEHHRKNKPSWKKSFLSMKNFRVIRFDLSFFSNSTRWSLMFLDAKFNLKLLTERVRKFQMFSS